MNEEQETEIATLQAIYPEELRIDPNAPGTLRFELRIRLEHPLRIQAARLFRDRNAGNDNDTKSLCYLPPLHLQMVLPEQYPTEAPPVVTLSTTPNWLERRLMAGLEAEMESLWREYGHAPVVFSYINYLEEISQNVFGFGKEQGLLVLHPEIAAELAAYDKKAAGLEFAKSNFECSICMSAKSGAVCYRIEPCRHVFCIECLQEYYTMVIEEGHFKAVECLSPRCWEELQEKVARGEVSGVMRISRQLSPRVLDQIPLRRATIRRYLKFMRKQAMEADRSVIWCPRSGCEGAVQHQRWPEITKHADWETLLECDWGGYEETNSTAGGGVTRPREPVTAEQERRGQLGVCEKCKFSFCLDCKATWHGEYAECPRGRVQSTSASAIIKTQVWTDKFTQKCPGCGIRVSKTEGCDHMTCRCGQEFYYCCGGRYGEDPAEMSINSHVCVDSNGKG